MALVRHLDPNISFKEAARRLGLSEGEFSTATTPQPGGRVWREDSAIVNLCTAQAARDVAVFYSANHTKEAVLDGARITARKAGYRIIDDKYVRSFRESYERQAPKIVAHMLEKYRKRGTPEKLLATFARALDTAARALKAARIEKVNDFFARWHIKRRLKGEAVKDIDKTIVDQWKFGRKWNKDKKYITALAAKKYFQRVEKRWGALGSLWYRAGLRLHPKLRKASSLVTPAGAVMTLAPVQKKFTREPYERMSVQITRHGLEWGGTIDISVTTPAENSMLFPSFTRGLQRGTEYSSAKALARIRKLLAAKAVNLFNV